MLPSELYSEIENPEYPSMEELRFRVQIVTGEGDTPTLYISDWFVCTYNLLEIMMKKYAIHRGLPLVSTNHNLGTIFSNVIWSDKPTYDATLTEYLNTVLNVPEIGKSSYTQIFSLRYAPLKYRSKEFSNLNRDKIFLMRTLLVAIADYLFELDID